MGKVRTPLISFGASGKLAGTLIYGSWKGLNTVKQYAVPENPQTSAQTSQRSAYAAAVSAWRLYLTNVPVREGWDKYASTLKRVMAGYHAAISSLSIVLKVDPDASYVSVPGKNITRKMRHSFANMDDGAVGDEAGNFTMYSGLDYRSLNLDVTGPLAAGKLTGTLQYSNGDTVYSIVYKDSQPRSGIVAVEI